MSKILFMFCLVLSAGLADIYQSVPEEKVHYVQKGEGKRYCSNCAMSLQKYYRTNHAHKGNQYCSLHCLVEKHGKNTPKNAKVVDNKSLKFINVKDAFYVLDSDKPATMGKISKYAFADEEDAKEFASKNGGEVMNFDAVYEIALDYRSSDNKVIRLKKEKKLYKEAKKLYKSKCKKIDTSKYKNIAKLKVALGSTCKTNKDKELQMLATYLWDTEVLSKAERKIESIKIPKNAKCPVCGMLVAKHSKWAVHVRFEEEDIYFDGIKDSIKYLIDRGQKDYVEHIYASDYFTGEKIDAKKAFFVVGSDVYGPMGKEIIPFKSDVAAYKFKNEHFGKSVLRYHEINTYILEMLE